MIEPLVSCQEDACAAEVSFHLDQVRMFKGEPVCENCYDDIQFARRRDVEEGEEMHLLPEWSDLPAVTRLDLRLADDPIRSVLAAIVQAADVDGITETLGYGEVVVRREFIELLLKAKEGLG